jgi:hypothetical protein
MRKTFRQSALALMLLGGAVLATAPAFAGYRHIYVGPSAVVAPPVAVASPVVAVEPYAPEVIVEPVVPVAPSVVGYAPPVPVAPEAECAYGPPAGPALEVGGY